MRILRVVLLLPVALAALVGCSPAREPLTALAVLDGKPTIVSVACASSHSTTSIHVREDRSTPPTGLSPSTGTTNPPTADPNPPTSPSAPSGGPSAPGSATADADSPSWSISSTDPQPVSEIELLGPPPAGWKLDHSNLHQLQPDVWYAIAAYGFRDSITLKFTTDVFEKLDAEHVLAPVGNRKQEIMTRSKFERNAKDVCPRR
ncbi:hypothetical protein [Plantactinospora soyae]|uniref:Uncharacterized protein n=1 Tax=Plantactinospora soyae TaxID=1544732 RepID=A0A927QX96_9ACTN|nr:hypothetical protein [Plantactinospora soyae]MBE1486452.1 hypothetical protein [Plantactinospora soyae]